MSLKCVCVCVLEESLSVLFPECNNATCENGLSNLFCGS